MAVELRDGTSLPADEFVLAVPHWLCSSLLPADALSDGLHGEFDRIETAAIASAHFWFDHPLHVADRETLK